MPTRCGGDCGLPLTNEVEKATGVCDHCRLMFDVQKRMAETGARNPTGDSKVERAKVDARPSF